MVDPVTTYAQASALSSNTPPALQNEGSNTDIFKPFTSKLDFIGVDKLKGKDVSSIPATNNVNYVMRLYELNGDLSIMAPAPRSFKVAMENQWIDVMSLIRDSLGGSGSALGGSAASAFKLAQSYSGTYLLPRALTLQVWSNSPPIRFQVPISLNAYNDPNSDVSKPLRDLMRMAAPKRDNAGFLRAPGPTLHEVISNKGDLNNVKHLLGLRIGRSINLRGLLLEGLDFEFESRFTKNGQPIAAEAIVTLKTYWTFSQDEYLDAVLSTGDN